MEVKYTQENAFGCGLYAIANATNDGSIITEERLEESKTGNTLHQLNTWLCNDDRGYVIDPIYLNLITDLQPAPPTGFDLLPVSEDQYFPFLLDTAHSYDGKKHLVGCYVDSKGNITVIDSLKEDQFTTTWPHLLSGAVYNVIVGVYGFSSIEEKGWKMLTIEQNPERSVATEDASSTTAD